MTTSFFPTLFSEKKHVTILLERKKTGIQFSHLPENKSLMKKIGYFIQSFSTFSQ
jgi:hypothetical protein